jgi:HK97 gp10 family phage protein
MPDVTVKIQGMEELKQRLDSLNDGKLARSMLRSGAREAAKVLKEGQRDTVPVDTGELRDSIGIQVKGTRADNLVVLVGPDKKYNFIGRFHEFGTVHQGASHWMQRAFDETSKAALDRFVVVVKKKLDVRDYKELQRQIAEGLSEDVEK